MAHLLNRVNADNYRRALEHLQAGAGETVLELGFGGGMGVDALLRQGVRVIASEPSLAMRARAYRRWSWPLAEGRLEIWPHAAEDLPERELDAVVSLNTVYFWRDVDAGFVRLRRMLTGRSARLLLGITPAGALRDAGFVEMGYRTEEPEWYCQRLEAAGFETSLVSAPRPASCAFVLARPRHEEAPG
jgi:hypothetical protein